MQALPNRNQSKPVQEPTSDECLLLLLRGIENHSVIAAGPHGEAFRKELSALELEFKAKHKAQRLVDGALQIVQKYASLTMEAMDRPKSRMASAASELNAALEALPNLQTSADHWARLEERVKAISIDDDLEAAKNDICAEIASSRAEALEERDKISQLFSKVTHKLEVRPCDDLSVSTSAADQLTGLPLRAYAEGELNQAHAEAGECYVAMFIVKRLALINAKFGYSRGDQVLLKVVSHLAHLLPEFRTMYRWSPCAFLTIAPATMSYKELRSKIQVIENTRLAPLLEWEGRSAMVPVGLDCRIISVKEFETVPDLFLRLDTLAADA